MFRDAGNDSDNASSGGGVLVLMWCRDEAVAFVGSYRDDDEEAIGM